MIDLLESRYADLYHFTNLRAVRDILASDSLRRGQHRGAFISLTRNMHWWGWNSNFTVRIVLNGETIRHLVARQGLRMRPIEEPRRGGNGNATRRGNIDEREERILGEKLDHVRSAIKAIDVIRAWANADDRHFFDLAYLQQCIQMQRSYQIPFTYEGEPLVTYAQHHLRWTLEDRMKGQKFYNGPLYSREPTDPDVWTVAHSVFHALHLI